MAWACLANHAAEFFHLSVEVAVDFTQKLDKAVSIIVELLKHEGEWVFVHVAIEVLKGVLALDRHRSH